MHRCIFLDEILCGNGLFYDLIMLLLNFCISNYSSLLNDSPRLLPASFKEQGTGLPHMHFLDFHALIHYFQWIVPVLVFVWLRIAICLSLFAFEIV